jgi:cytochrome d ubiquinol oxidase subunit I
MCAALMLGLVMVGAWLRWKGRLYDAPFFLWLAKLATPVGFVAVIAGWCTTEVGRQPWTVYGLLRTADSVSPSPDELRCGAVARRLCPRLSAHLSHGLLLMLRIIRKGPSDIPEQASKIESGLPEAPVLAGAFGLAKGEAQ